MNLLHIVRGHKDAITTVLILIQHNTEYTNNTNTNTIILMKKESAYLICHLFLCDVTVCLKMYIQGEHNSLK